MIYSEGGGSAFVQMCASLNACPQKDKNHWPVLHGAHRHWHALHQAKESLFSIRLLISASKHSLSSSIFSHLICQRLKKQRQKSRGGEFAPCALQSLHRWKAEFHLKMFGIVLRWIKLPQTGWVWCDIFGQAATNRIHQKQKFLCLILRQGCIHYYMTRLQDLSSRNNNLWHCVQVEVPHIVVEVPACKNVENQCYEHTESFLSQFGRGGSATVFDHLSLG